MTDPAKTNTDPRVARSRSAIIAAATQLFLERGFLSTTMDDVAETAPVSKRTVYNHFADKESLFREVVMNASSRAEAFAIDVTAGLSEPTDLAEALTALARRLVAQATDPAVVRLRRLLIGEAHRFPALAAEYYDAAPGRVMASLEFAFGSLADSGRLRMRDPRLAAEQFAFLVLGSALDRAMFDGKDRGPDAAQSTVTADEGVRVFLAAYG